jgi:hypothetical protein
MRFLIIILFAISTVFLTACESVNNEMTVNSILISNNATDIDESAPSKVLAIVKQNKTNEKAWQALHHYSSLTDAGATLMFYRDCFNALKEDPLLFFDRYMTGDEQAIFRMIDALSHDFSAFEETYEQSDRVFQNSFRLIMDFMRQHSKEREVYRRAYNFQRVSQAQYNSWRLHYCEFIRTGSEIVATNCAPWEKKL